MPGKRYNFLITRGPWKGKRARIIGTAATAGNFLAAVQGVELPDHAIPSIWHQWLKPISHKTTTSKKGGKKSHAR
ncbi:MAG: hypothetical protein HY508_10845 [Acidobacteria bacterium]|nr:hypothetical protein [Acidobacteriota bacterium]